MFGHKYVGREPDAYQERTQIDLQSRTSSRHHVRQRLQLHRIPDIKKPDQRSRKPWIGQANLGLEPFHSGKRRSVSRPDHRRLGKESLTTNREGCGYPQRPEPLP